MQIRLTRAIAAALVAFALPAAAQQSAPETEDATELEAITVTGTNIKGADVEGAQPLIVIDREDIARSGAESVFDLLQRLPQARGGAGTFSEAQSGTRTGESPPGSAGISLRGLGTASTLTLINGRRVTVSSFANGSESFVDVNAIPLAAIDRIEILATGASAIYGADAVGGVVNYILRKDYDGAEITARLGDSTRGTDETRGTLSGVWGMPVGDAGNFTIYGDYFKRQALYDRDRAISAVEPRPSQQGIFPSFNVDPRLRLPDQTEVACTTRESGRLGEYCPLNRNAYTVDTPSAERMAVGGSLNLDFDGTLWFTEFFGSHNRSKANADPAPWSSVDMDERHPNLPAELLARFRQQIPNESTWRLRGWGRFPDAREVGVESDTLRFVSGLSGVFESGWNWEAAANWSRVEQEQRALAGIYRVDRFVAAMNGQLCPTGATNCTPTTGGLYYNPFGGQASNSQQVLDLLRAEVPRNGESSLLGFDAKTSGELFTFADRSVLAAFGVDWRRERAEDRPDPLATANPITGDVPVYGFGSTQVDAERDAWAAYAEMIVPLADTVELQLAARHDDDEQFGGDTNPKVSLRWQPLDNFLVRANWATSFRAPSLAQVGAGVTLSSGAVRCSAQSEFFNTFCGGFAGDDSYLSEIYGNPDLEAETAKAWNLGFAWDPLENLNFTVDWWRIRHENLVDIDADELFRRALRQPGLVFVTGTLGPGQIGIETRNGTIGSPVRPRRWSASPASISTRRRWPTSRCRGAMATGTRACVPNTPRTTTTTTSVSAYRRAAACRRGPRWTSTPSGP